MTGADLGAFDSIESGYVTHLRRTFNRDHGTFTRSSWDEERRKEMP